MYDKSKSVNSNVRIAKDNIFHKILSFASLLIVLISAGIILALVSGSIPAIKEFGLIKFICSSQWNSHCNTGEQYGALPFIIGTLLTSFLALLICIPLSLPVALFTGEYFAGEKIANIMSSVIDLLAGIPSVVYGLWGFYTLRQIMISCRLSEQGFGIITASIVLAIMIIPYAASLSTQFIKLVPNELKEGSYSLGATHAEVIKSVIIPYSKSGIISSYILALGRALGETMAVTMLIGNTNVIPHSLTDTSNTMASIIANQFGEADGLKLSSLITIGLILFMITIIINIIGRVLMRRKIK